METLIMLGKVVVPAYVALLALAYFYQDVLIVMPQARSERDLQAIVFRHAAVEEVRLHTDDGVTLHGWFLKSAVPNGSSAPLTGKHGFDHRRLRDIQHNRHSASISTPET